MKKKVVSNSAVTLDVSTPLQATIAKDYAPSCQRLQMHQHMNRTKFTATISGRDHFCQYPWLSLPSKIVWLRFN